MNLFVLDMDPQQAARMHKDQHLLKMAMEAAQMMSTAWLMLHPEQIVWVYDSNLNESRPQLMGRRIYKIAQAGNKVTQWVRSSGAAYRWTWALADQLCKEYRLLRGKPHPSEAVIDALWHMPPKLFSTQGDKVEFFQRVGQGYEVQGDPVLAYRLYYLGTKCQPASWTRRRKPPAWTEDIFLKARADSIKEQGHAEV